MPDPAIAKVEDALKAVLLAHAPLIGQTVLTEQSVDIAIDESQFPAIAIYTVAYSVDQADEHWQTIHTATVEFECIDGIQALGSIGRANHTTIAHIIAALAQDRSLGGMLHDIQEIDVAPASPRGKDVGSASLQVRVTFFTGRADWFTIIGQNGQTF